MTIFPKLFAVVTAMICALGIHAQEAYAVYTEDNSTLTFYYDSQRSTRPGTTYDLNIGSNNPGWRGDGIYMSVTRAVFDSSFADARPTTTYYWFRGMENLTTILGIEYLNTSEVTNMNAMFYKCQSLTSLNVSTFNTSSVTDMNSMFNRCSGLTSLDVSGFNTSNVTNMVSMFYRCSGLTSLDVSSFSTANVDFMGYMFFNCSGLTTIYAGDGWSTAAVTESSSMFFGCTNLVGGMGTTYDANYTDKTYARIDGGPSNPGYFTDKNASLRGDVNGDGQVNITDVIKLINAILSSDYSGIITANANVNGDSEENITDVIQLINYVSTGHW